MSNITYIQLQVKLHVHSIMHYVVHFHCALCISTMQFQLYISTLQFSYCNFHFTIFTMHFHLAICTMHLHYAIYIVCFQYAFSLCNFHFVFPLCISIDPWSFKLQVKILWMNIKNNSKSYGNSLKQKIVCPHPPYSHWAH
jgi:hypothetical protein